MVEDIVTFEGVPGNLREMWAQSLTPALTAATTAPQADEWDEHSPAAARSERAWRELLMLPKAVLCRPLRAGIKHKRQAHMGLQHRLQQLTRTEFRLPSTPPAVALGPISRVMQLITR